MVCVFHWNYRITNKRLNVVQLPADIHVQNCNVSKSSITRVSLRGHIRSQVSYIPFTQVIWSGRGPSPQIAWMWPTDPYCTVFLCRGFLFSPCGSSWGEEAVVVYCH